MKLRASSLYRYRECPAAWHLEQNATRLPESDDATRGTRIHAWLAGQSVDLSPDEEDDASACLAKLDEITMSLPETDEVIVEREFSLRVNGDEVTGHPDRIEIRGNHALVVDWKLGYNDVELAESNLQLGAYSLMLAGSRGDIDEFTLAIIQPNVRSGGSVATFTRGELVGFWRQLCEIVLRIKHMEGPNPGESQCRYCPCAGTNCPAIKREMATLDTMALDAPMWAVYSPEDKIAAYDLASRLMKACGTIHALCRADLEANPGAFGGALYLKPGAVKASITDPAGLFRSLAMDCGLTSEEFVGTVSVAKTKLAPVVKAKKGLKGKAFDEYFEAALKPYVEEKQNAPRVERRKP